MKNRIYLAYLDDFNVITIIYPKHFLIGKSNYFTLLLNDEEIELHIEHSVDINGHIKYICHLPTFIELGKTVYIKDQYENLTDLQSGKIVRTKRFDTLYFYDGDDLGAHYTNTHTVFKVWAPTATSCSLILKKDHKRIVYLMKRSNQGVYELSVDGDLDGYLYRYLITNNQEKHEVIDVYGKASNANHCYSAVVNPQKLITVSSLNKEIKLIDSIIYELHIRDFSIDPHGGFLHKGKYLGIIEKNTLTKDGILSGLDYLIDLGITHIQFLPFFDFSGVDELNPESAYNWGYNPEQFNTPEGSYSTNPDDIYSRLNELRHMINVLHEHGIGVIMDVVFNHVFHMNVFPFESMIPGYFYRYDEYGFPTNGSGCGNDLATERKMVRKVIVDSILYWAKEFKVDGFRFDLMGLIDMETIRIVRKELDNINPQIFVYGEGWNLHTALPYVDRTVKEHASQLPNISFFNDDYRDCIKGSPFDLHDRGYALGDFSNLEKIKRLISGSIDFFYDPSQSLNFLECHDNMTMYDKCKSIFSESKQHDIRKIQRFANSILLISQGIPFIHAGQEFCRTKHGIENSYNLPDRINQIDWKRVKKYEQDIEYFKELIKLRKSNQAFRLPTAHKIKKHCHFLKSKDDGIMIMELLDIQLYGNYQEIKIILNGKTNEYLYNIDSDFKIIFDTCFYEKGKTPINPINIPELSMVVIAK